MAEGARGEEVGEGESDGGGGGEDAEVAGCDRGEGVEGAGGRVGRGEGQEGGDGEGGEGVGEALGTVSTKGRYSVRVVFGCEGYGVENGCIMNLGTGRGMTVGTYRQDTE